MVPTAVNWAWSVIARKHLIRRRKDQISISFKFALMYCDSSTVCTWSVDGSQESASLFGKSRRKPSLHEAEQEVWESVLILFFVFCKSYDSFAFFNELPPPDSRQWGLELRSLVRNAFQPHCCLCQGAHLQN